MIVLLPYHLSIDKGFVFSTESLYDTLDDRVELCDLSGGVLRT